MSDLNPADRRRIRLLKRFSCSLVILVVFCLFAFWLSKVFFVEKPRAFSNVRLDEFSARLTYVPMNVGVWQGVDIDFSQKWLKMTKLRGCVFRKYTNQTTGEEVHVQVLVGTARHVVIESPEIWAFYQEATPTIYRLDSDSETQPLEFLTTTFANSVDEDAEKWRMFWSFSDDGTWNRPGEAKQRYFRGPALFKVNIKCPVLHSNGNLDEHPAVEFARDFMPALNEAIFADGDPRSRHNPN